MARDELKNTMVEFKIRIPPVPKGRPRFGRSPRGKVFTCTPTRTSAYEEAVQLFAKSSLPSRWMKEGLFRVHLRFLVNVQKAKDPIGRLMAIGDIDNLSKACLDAFNGIIYNDDKQVMELILEKGITVPGEEEGTLVRVSRWNF